MKTESLLSEAVSTAQKASNKVESLKKPVASALIGLVIIIGQLPLFCIILYLG
jgi:hypothetical protein